MKRPQSFVAATETGERRLDVVEFFEVATDLGADYADIAKALDDVREEEEERRMQKQITAEFVL